MKSKIWLSSPHMGGREMKYVQEAYDTNWVAPLGPNVTAFEEELADYLDIKRTDVDEEYKQNQIRIAEAKLAEQIRSNTAKEEIAKEKATKPTK